MQADKRELFLPTEHAAQQYRHLKADFVGHLTRCRVGVEEREPEHRLIWVTQQRDIFFDPPSPRSVTDVSQDATKVGDRKDVSPARTVANGHHRIQHSRGAEGKSGKIRIRNSSNCHLHRPPLSEYGHVHHDARVLLRKFHSSVVSPRRGRPGCPSRCLRQHCEFNDASVVNQSCVTPE